VETKDIVTLALAAYGSLLSSALAVIGWREKRRVLRVTASIGAPFPAPEVHFMFLIEVVNPGHRPVTINNVGLVLPNKKELVLIDSGPYLKLPRELKEGTSCSAMIPAKDILATLKEQGLNGTIFVHPYCRDALGKRHKGKRYEINVDLQL